MTALYLLAVDEGPERQVFGIDIPGVDEDGTERTEPILALDAEHRPAVSVPKVVDAPVVCDGVAADVVECFGDSHLAAAPSDHHRDLSLVVQEAATAGANHGLEMRGE